MSIKLDFSSSQTYDEYDNLQDLRKANVLLHCSDMTQIGGLSNYQKAIDTPKRLNPELKLVIAGNHDVSLDSGWWVENLIGGEDDPDEPVKALALFRNKDALDAGLSYLEEGTHAFTLKSGATFTIYASTSTSAFQGYDFPYVHNDDRFKPAYTLSQGVRAVAAESIPEGVDVVITHGPPQLEEAGYALDLNEKQEHCGCPHLWMAVKR